MQPHKLTQQTIMSIWIWIALFFFLEYYGSSEEGAAVLRKSATRNKIRSAIESAGDSKTNIHLHGFLPGDDGIPTIEKKANVEDGNDKSINLEEWHPSRMADEIPESSLLDYESDQRHLGDIHLKLEARRKQRPGNLTRELEDIGADLPAKQNESDSGVPWWIILLLVLIVLAIIALLLLYFWLRKKREEEKKEPEPVRVHGHATYRIVSLNDPRVRNCLSAGYIDEITEMHEEEELNEPVELHGVHSSEFPSHKKGQYQRK